MGEMKRQHCENVLVGTKNALYLFVYPCSNLLPSREQETVLVSSTSKDFQKAYEGEM